MGQGWRKGGEEMCVCVCVCVYTCICTHTPLFGPHRCDQRCHLSMHNVLGVRQPGKLWSQNTLIFPQQIRAAALMKNHRGNTIT